MKTPPPTVVSIPLVEAVRASEIASSGKHGRYLEVIHKALRLGLDELEGDPAPKTEEDDRLSKAAATPPPAVPKESAPRIPLETRTIARKVATFSKPAFTARPPTAPADRLPIRTESASWTRPEMPAPAYNRLGAPPPEPTARERRESSRIDEGYICSTCKKVIYVPTAEFHDIQAECARTRAKPVCPNCKGKEAS